MEQLKLVVLAPKETSSSIRNYCLYMIVIPVQHRT